MFLLLKLLFLSFSTIWDSKDALASNLAHGKTISTIAGVNVSAYTNRSARGVEGSGIDFVMVVGATLWNEGTTDDVEAAVAGGVGVCVSPSAAGSGATTRDWGQHWRSEQRWKCHDPLDCQDSRQ